jgi:hypothetical protein
MPKDVYIIGTHPDELKWVRMLVALLRHPDPIVVELTRQALIYLTKSAVARQGSGVQSLDHAG